MTHNLNAVVRVLEQQERNLHIILDKAPLSPQLHKQMKDHAAQTSLLSKRIENYGMRLSGVAVGVGSFLIGMLFMFIISMPPVWIEEVSSTCQM